ncbi:hypothetical protein [Achromobacter marplatensis]|uniref:hypothetical protein n=1 Tax=Achromobacter marplatensis TaxID=470868 RepID=UPI0028EE1660|nr:hypothetical protein [Achromobacter marplatensis]
MSVTKPNYPQWQRTAADDEEDIGGSGGGGDNGDMKARVKALEDTVIDVRERLARIETRLSHVATSDDVSKVESSLLKWFIGTAIALVGLAFAAAKLIH